VKGEYREVQGYETSLNLRTGGPGGPFVWPPSGNFGIMYGRYQRGGEMSGERMDRREFFAKVLGLGGIAAASLVAAGCGGDDDDDEGEDD
jgi:hypothetical protein